MRIWPALLLLPMTACVLYGGNDSADDACASENELACMADPTCRATYRACPPTADCLWSFDECRGIAPPGPVFDRTACQALDAYDCSLRNDCIARYGLAGFVECAPEPFQGCYSENDCPAGWDCTAGTDCLPPPDCRPGQLCPRVCYGQCLPQTQPL